ncbi:hypothetical protein [Wielerella bovis]|uniref:hypothetical protein n=1 Tax=Wielerella bovis TaxID=2917790 RepID=UPI002019B550|nr:hypothetical protein [Wielerella bovis]MCG7656579.1 hypothetical protein [Wielerella bovis]MCG7658804.1 hypothetical protein [Wielerella bovis]
MMMGIRMSLGLFVQPLANDTALFITQISFVNGGNAIGMGCIAADYKALADRYGTWTILWLGMLLLVIFAPTAWGLTIGIGLVVFPF